MMRNLFLLLLVAGMATAVCAADDPVGFNGALWGQSPDEVRKSSSLSSWQSDPVEKKFPPECKVTVFRTSAEVAGYKATVLYYFWDKRFFQATVNFDFSELATFDFNYNVYRSVSEYYTFIRSKTTVFVQDVFALLEKKYGKKEPVFKGLDPRRVFVTLDAYITQERWNFRYHPFDFYQRIVTASYARWDFPHTRVLFSMNLAAAEKRFDYTLSIASIEMADQLQKVMDRLRAKGL